MLALEDDDPRGDLLAEARRIPGMAGQSSVTSDWAPVAQRIREEATEHWNAQVAVDRFTGKDGRFVRGNATITGPRSVEVDGTTYEASRGLVIASGAAPAVPPLDGIEDVDYLTNHEAVETETLPESLLVLGGGVVGLELGQAMSRFGTKVTVVEAEERPVAAARTRGRRADRRGVRGGRDRGLHGPAR